MPRALVTGGAGFLGSHLCGRLLSEGVEVLAVDNLLTGSLDNVADLQSNPRFRYVNHDVTTPFPKEITDGAFDYVFHLASPASPIDFPTKPIEIMRVNSLGTELALQLARDKGARFFFASTSEVYGDPLVHPQTESYWGNVNPIGVRGVYDESKRYGEAITMAYRRTFGVDTKLVRIFNSILANETALVFDGDEMHLTAIGDYADSLEKETIRRPHRLRVPAFDPATGQVSLREAEALIKHPPVRDDAFLLKTRYGREIRVTGDHSVFRRGKDGLPEAVPVREMQVGDYVAIAGQLPVVERDRPTVNIAEAWIHKAATPESLWDLALISPSLSLLFDQRAEQIFTILSQSGRYNNSKNVRNNVGCAFRKFKTSHTLPLAVIVQLQKSVRFDWPEDARIRLFQAGAFPTLPNLLPITDDLLWFLGLFLAEGTIASYLDKHTHFITLCSHMSALDRAKRIMEETFGVAVGRVAPTAKRGPSVYAHSKLLCWVMSEVLGMKGLSAQKRISPWIMQLPLSRFKYFLEGYREGDGTHSGASVGQRLNFVTVSRGLSQDLLYGLLRFGIVATIGNYTSTISRYPEKRYPFFSITVQGLSCYDVLTWDTGVAQTLQAGRFGDLVWALVKEIEPVATTPYVYDFSVPGHENFVAGTGVFAHNTYGERMRLSDGRVVPNFVGQALRGDPITVYGTGQQTRSFCYASDLIDGFWRLVNSDQSGPINIGNPTERTMLEFAEQIKALTGSDSPIVYEELKTPDDPKQRRPDITKAKELLGWEPKVSLEEGLTRTIAYFKGKLGK